MKNGFFLVFLALAMAAAAVLPYAASAQVGYAQELGCRIDFNIAYINSIIAVFPNASTTFQGDLTILSNDKAQLATITNATDYKAFATQYQTDMKGVRTDYQQWRQSVKLTLKQRVSIISSYGSEAGLYLSCRSGALERFAQNRISNYNSDIVKYQNVSDKWAVKGFNTTSLNALLSDAQAQVIQPLQAAVTAAGNDSTLIETALRTYCLYDGCGNGTNFHLEAKWDVTKLQVVYDYLQNNSATFNLTQSQLDSAFAHINSARSGIGMVGSSAYQSGDGRGIYSDIGLASKSLVALVQQASSRKIGGLK